MHRYECPRCGELLETDAAPGTMETCPACRRRHRIPKPLAQRIRTRVRKTRRSRQRAEAAGDSDAPETEVVLRDEVDATPLPAGGSASDTRVPPAAEARAAPRPRPAAPTSEPGAAEQPEPPRASGREHGGRRHARVPSYGGLYTSAVLLKVTAVLLWLLAAVYLVLIVVGTLRRAEATGFPALAGMLSVLPAVGMAVSGLVLFALGHLLVGVRDIALNSFHPVANTERLREPES